MSNFCIKQQEVLTFEVQLKGIFRGINFIQKYFFRGVLIRANVAERRSRNDPRCGVGCTRHAVAGVGHGPARPRRPPPGHRGRRRARDRRGIGHLLPEAGGTMTTETRTPLVEMRNMNVAFGGVHAVEDVSIDLYAGEVVAIVGGNGAGKTTLIRTLSGAHPADSGEISIDGTRAAIGNPRDAKALGVETIYQTLALAENQNAPANMFLGREIMTRWNTLDDSAMEDAFRKVMARLNPKFLNFRVPVQSLSGGQRQSIAIAKAVYFNARIIIMDEPTAALGPAETAQVGELIKQLKSEGIGIFLISHDIHDVFDLADRIAVMHTGNLVGIVNKAEVTKDEVLAMIIMGKASGEVTESDIEELH